MNKDKVKKANKIVIFEQLMKDIITINLKIK